MKKMYLVFLIVLGFCFQYGNAQTISEKDKQLGVEFDKLLSAQYKPDEPGCVVLVARKRQIIYEKAFGMADLELSVPNNVNMVFEIGSITKQFTAVAIMQLVEQGKISLQDPINKFIEDYPTHGYTITIENLLTHTSGIKDYWKMKEFDSTFWRKDYTTSEFINFFKNEPMDFAPGTNLHYSNSGFCLLGYIIEKVSGMTYAKYIEENIFKPAGMKNSYYGNFSKIIKNRAKGYQIGAEGIKNANYISWTVVYSAGSLMSIVEDFLKYYQALNSFKLIKKESLEKTRTSYKLSNGKETGYGYGIGVGNVMGSPIVGHAGGIFGFYSNQLYFPNEDVSVIIFTNCESYINKDPSMKIAALVLGK
ncbi:MAG: serine hydrolase domain-containing protein [Bacteroidota bacterium]|jgi:CubicO group peptidase (beta-lactamase class C family)